MGGIGKQTLLIGKKWILKTNSPVGIEKMVRFGKKGSIAKFIEEGESILFVLDDEEYAVLTKAEFESTEHGVVAKVNLTIKNFAGKVNFDTIVVKARCLEALDLSK